MKLGNKWGRWSLGLLILFSSGCAGTRAANQKLDDKLAQEPVASNHALDTEEQADIRQAQLTDDQKGRLDDLRSRLHVRLEANTQESVRLRSLLLKELLSPGYDEQEVGVIEDRLQNLDDQHLSLTFAAVEAANVILGREASSHSSTLAQLLDGRAPHSPTAIDR